jgi:hypothetical protein
MHAQEELRRVLDARVRAAGPAGPCRSRMPAIAVLRDFDPRCFARTALDFAVSLNPAQRRDWQADFTRTVYLTGNPRNLAGRLPPSVVDPDGRVAWYASRPKARQRELRLLLRAVQGELPSDLPESVTVDVPGHGTTHAREARRWRMTVSTEGLSLPRYLVHVGHTLTESLLTGVLTPGDRLTVCHAAAVPGLPCDYAYLRVHQDVEYPDRLRAYAGIAEEAFHG